MMDEPPDKEMALNRHQILMQLLVAMAGSWGYFCMGAVRGWSSPSIPSLNRTIDFETSPSDLQWISSLPMVGAILGSLLINNPMQCYGRKKVLIGHYCFFIFGFLLTGLTYFVKEKSFIYVGRFLMGFGAGSTIPASQIYVSECALPKFRGRIASMTTSSLTLGVWVTYIVGHFVEWHELAWVLGCLPILFLLGTALMPESPSWLIANGREQEARKSLQRLRGTHFNLDTTVRLMKDHQAEMLVTMQNQSAMDDILTRPVLRPLGISLGIMFFQQTTGINAIIFDAGSVLKMAGIEMDELYANMIIGAVQLIFTTASGFLVDKLGRRDLLLGSAITSSVSLAGMGIFFQFQRRWGEKEALKNLGWLPIVSLSIFLITCSVGMSNIPYIVMGEMFPFRYRPLLAAISSAFNLTCMFIMITYFPDMLRAFGHDGTFYFFAGCTCLSIVYVHLVLPETTCKTLEEVEQLFQPTKTKCDEKNRNTGAEESTDLGVNISSSYEEVANESQRIENVFAIPNFIP